MLLNKEKLALVKRKHFDEALNNLAERHTFIAHGDNAFVSTTDDQLWFTFREMLSDSEHIAYILEDIIYAHGKVSKEISARKIREHNEYIAREQKSKPLEVIPY
jgi:hypothetical protein